MYVTRDSAGKIVARYARRQYPGQEWIDESSPEWGAIDLSDAKARKNEEIKAAYEQALAAGFVCSNGIKMDAMPDAVQLLDGGVRLAQKARLPTISIRDYDNVVHPDLPVTDVDSMVTELAANVQTQLAKKWKLQGQVDTATTVSEVDAIVW